jgi:hypothetical protein
VGGLGHLATATRIELVRLGIQQETDYRLASLHAPLVIACADREDDESFGEVAGLAADIGSPLLLACLTGSLLRVGPLIHPPRGCPRRTSHVGDLTDIPGNVSLSEADTDRFGEPGPRLSLHARLGALLICAQAVNFVLGARNQCVLHRVIELNPWSIESKAYRVLKVRQ